MSGGILTRQDAPQNASQFDRPGTRPRERRQSAASTNAAASSRRPSYESLKIARAVEEEIAETGMELDKFLALRPVEKRTRLIERMKKWKFATDEIPEERSFRDYFKRLKSDHDRKVGTLQEA